MNDGVTTILGKLPQKEKIAVIIIIIRFWRKVLYQSDTIKI